MCKIHVPLELKVMQTQLKRTINHAIQNNSKIENMVFVFISNYFDLLTTV